MARKRQSGNARSGWSATSNGTTVAHAMHDHQRGIMLQYWYYVRRPCGGWTMFDIRELARLSGQPHPIPDFDATQFEIARKDPDAYHNALLAAVAAYCSTVDIERHAPWPKEQADG